jgi:hypothetical protein
MDRGPERLGSGFHLDLAKTSLLDAARDHVVDQRKHRVRRTRLCDRRDREPERQAIVVRIAQPEFDIGIQSLFQEVDGIAVSMAIDKTGQGLDESVKPLSDYGLQQPIFILEMQVDGPDGAARPGGEVTHGEVLITILRENFAGGCQNAALGIIGWEMLGNTRVMNSVHHMNMNFTELRSAVKRRVWFQGGFMNTVHLTDGTPAEHLLVCYPGRQSSKACSCMR